MQAYGNDNTSRSPTSSVDSLDMRPPDRQPSASHPETIDGQKLPLRTPHAEREFDAADAFIRLLLGGTAELTDLFLQVLANWESEIAHRHETTIVEEEEDLGDILRYLLIGLTFESQHTVRSSVGTVGSWVLGAAGATAALSRPITNSWLFSPARRGASAFTRRLDARIAELVRIGRSQEFAGRVMAEHALEDSVDWLMNYIAQNPDIRNLVQQQAIGFSEEITVGVRERAITSDNVIDGLLRKLLRRTPRSDLPGPPEEVQQHAKTMRRLQQE